MEELALAEDEADGEACEEYVHSALCIADPEVELVEDVLLDGHEVQEEDELGDAQDVPVL